MLAQPLKPRRWGDLMCGFDSTCIPLRFLSTCVEINRVMFFHKKYIFRHFGNSKLKTQNYLLRLCSQSGIISTIGLSEK